MTWLYLMIALFYYFKLCIHLANLCKYCFSQSSLLFNTLLLIKSVFKNWISGEFFCQTKVGEFYFLNNANLAAAAAAKSLQSCPTRCDPIDGSPPGCPVPGILQVRTLEWVAISFSNSWKWKVKVKSLSCVQLLVTPWTAAHQAPPSMGFSRQEYWSGVPSPSPKLSYIHHYIDCKRK